MCQYVCVMGTEWENGDKRADSKAWFAGASTACVKREDEDKRFVLGGGSDLVIQLLLQPPARSRVFACVCCMCMCRRKYPDLLAARGR